MLYFNRIDKIVYGSDIMSNISNQFLVLLYTFLCGIMFIILFIFIIHILNSEKKKAKYYKGIIYFETDFGKHSEMVERQKILLLKKKIQLYFLTFLVKIKEVIKK